MPRAEIGSTKHQSNMLKEKGLGRLRWYCTPCAKQCRDANGFRCHVTSESHVRSIESLGETTSGVLQQKSSQFISAFVRLLRTSYGEKPVHVNRFYQTYIADPQHVHLNATRWTSLGEVTKHLSRDGVCRVEEKDDGLWIAWIDTGLGALEPEHLSAVVPISFGIGTAKTGSASATKKKLGNNAHRPLKRPQKQVGLANAEDRKHRGAYEADSKRERKKVRVEQ